MKKKYSKKNCCKNFYLFSYIEIYWPSKKAKKKYCELITLTFARCCVRSEHMFHDLRKNLTKNKKRIAKKNKRKGTAPIQPQMKQKKGYKKKKKALTKN